MTKRIKRAIGFILIVLSVLLAYALFCYYIGFGIPCIFNIITGFKCPGCGITRMCLSLLRLDFKSAFYYNPAILIMLPLFLVILIRAVYVYIKNGNLNLGKVFDIIIYIIIIILIIFGILRNVF